MKKTTLLLLFFFGSITFSHSQSGAWTWMSGSSAYSQGNFGIMGITSPANQPPALYEACEWTDLQGRFWLYGGSAPGGDNLSLWMYDPISGLWTWMNGASTIGFSTPTFGAKGIPSTGVNPGSVGYGASSWVDKQGDLWLFGGSDYSDLWKYNVSTNMWTWMNGPGVKFAPDA